MNYIIKSLVLLLILIFVSHISYAIICYISIYTNDNLNECGAYCSGDLAIEDIAPGWEKLPYENKCKELESVNLSWSWSGYYCLYNNSTYNHEGFCSALGYKFVEEVPKFENSTNILVILIPIIIVVIVILWLAFHRKKNSRSGA